MKKVALWNCYEDFNYDNAAFDPKKFTLSNNLNYWMILLQIKLAKLQIELVTPDTYPLGDYDAFIFVDYPDNVVRPETMSWIANRNKPMYLILFENPYIKPINYNEEFHKAFNKVFTWWPVLAARNEKLYKVIGVPQMIPDYVLNNPKDKLFSMVACNKQSVYTNELYSMRKGIIDHLTTYYKPDFDLYGVGWGDEPAYKGYVPDKLNTISRYKFNFCLENFWGFEGYITEKLFDAMFAGTVPVYLGDPTIKNVLPEKTAIYVNDYVDISDLAVQLTNMTDKEYNERLKNIQDFVRSDTIQKYSANAFCDTFIKNMDIHGDYWNLEDYL